MCTKDLGRSNERVTDAAIRQQLTYWRNKAAKSDLAAQLVGLLEELQRYRSADSAPEQP